MAISNAERQARYRENKRLGSKEQELGGKRLDCWLSTEAFLALGRLSRHQGESKRAVLESLILAADLAQLEAQATDEELEAYLGVTG
jgi:hypothetical protein